jgi:ribA/ribD-fused uncharacterized protein
VNQAANYIFFYGSFHPLSQWYISFFDIYGIRFNSTEQWMMYAKAMLFGDDETANKVLISDSPSNQRKLGRQVKHFNEALWIDKRESIIYHGNYEKFTQNIDLRNYLLQTGVNILAEASPTDLIWGIGLAIDNEDRFNMEKWRGQNLLGKILMKIRKDLIKEDAQKEIKL